MTTRQRIFLGLKRGLSTVDGWNRMTKGHIDSFPTVRLKDINITSLFSNQRKAKHVNPYVLLLLVGTQLNGIEFTLKLIV